MSFSYISNVPYSCVVSMNGYEYLRSAERIYSRSPPRASWVHFGGHWRTPIHDRYLHTHWAHTWYLGVELQKTTQSRQFSNVTSDLTPDIHPSASRANYHDVHSIWSRLMSSTIDRYMEKTNRLIYIYYRCVEADLVGWIFALDIFFTLDIFSQICLDEVKFICWRWDMWYVLMK